MNTPITKRIHMNAAKKNSVAKQTTNSSGAILVTDKDNNVLEASADITKNKNQKKTIYSTGKSLKGLTDEQLKWRENEIKRLGGIDAYHEKYGDPKKGKAREIDTGNAQNNVNFNYEQVLTKPTKGTTVDTSTAYNVRQISRGQKKAARDVRRAKIKLSKLGIQDTAGNWVAKTGISDRNKYKFEERLAELKGTKNTQKRILAMAEAGADPRRTARFEIGTEMKAGDPGGKLVKDTSGKYQTKEEFENKAKKEAGINLGSTSSEESNTSQGDALSSELGTMPQGDALNKILRKDIDKKQNAQVTKPVSTAMSNVVSQGYSTMVAKKYNKPTSMLKKSGMKMGGFGSKTYKK